MDAQQQVFTHVGTLPMSVLRYEMKEYKEPNIITVAREWYYTGSDPAVLEKIAGMDQKFVKRDVWTTVLCGESTTAEAKL